MAARSLLLCTDLDRTLVPNGTEPESPEARARFADVAAEDGIVLVYVTGRDLKLLERAVGDFELPRPDYAITDVGTKIHESTASDWRVVSDWETLIRSDWGGREGAELAEIVGSLEPLRLQEPHKQNTYKLSYYAPVRADRPALEGELTRRLGPHGIDAGFLWSIDEPARIGLLDVVPAGANKLHALQFLREHLAYPLDETLFAGDSGNDLEVLESAIPSVLVANASPEIRTEALERARAAGNEAALYIAKGGFLGMNGNYAAGILEGIAHFHQSWSSSLSEGRRA